MAYGNNYGGGNNYNRSNYGGPRNSKPPVNYAPKQTTKGLQLTNGQIGRFLQVDYWGNNVTVVIGATAPGQAIDWNAMRNAQSMKVNLVGNDLFEIWDICEEVIDSIKNSGTFTSAACRVGTKQDSLIEISNGSNLNLGPGIYLVIYKNLDASNRTNTLEFYQFSSTKIMRGYDHTSGVWKDDPIKIGEFKKFYRTIMEAAKAMTNAQAHAIANVTYSDKISGFKAMAAVTAALGIDMQKEMDAIIKGTSRSSGSGGGRSGGSYGGGQRSDNNGWNNGPQNRYNTPRSAAFESGPRPFDPTQSGIGTTVDDPVDIILPMSELSSGDMTDFG